MATESEKREEQIPIEIPPKDGSTYVDQFWSAMFGNLGAFVQAEQRLIWARYSAFLVVNTIIFAFVKDALFSPNDNNAWTLLVAGVLGLLICGIWAFLNYCGWRHQNKLFWYASRLQFKVEGLSLPTDMFKRRSSPEPFGPIYWSAQVLPIAFGAVDCLCTYPAIAMIDVPVAILHWGIVILLGSVTIVAVFFFCKLVSRQDSV